MQPDELLAIVAALILPTVQKDMGKDATDLLDVIEESVSYAADIVQQVKDLEEGGDDDDGDGATPTPSRSRSRSRVPST